MTTSQHVKRPRKGRGATRVDGYGPVARRATGVVISLGLAGGIVGGLAVGSATADPASLTLNYSCALPEPIGGYPVTVEMLSDIPTSITAGEPTSQFPIEARTPVTEHQAQMLHNIKVRSLDGTVTADVNVTAPQDDENFTIPFDVAKTTVPASDSFRVEAVGAAPELTFDQPGTGEIAVGDLSADLTAVLEGGETAEFHTTCTLEPGQDGVVATFDITAAGESSDPAAPGATGDSPSGSGVAGGAPSEGETGGSPSESGTSGGSPSESGTTEGSSSGSGGSTTEADQAGDDAQEDTSREDSATDSDEPSDDMAATGGQGIETLSIVAASAIAFGTLAMFAAIRARRAKAARQTP